LRRPVHETWEPPFSQEYIAAWRAWQDDWLKKLEEEIKKIDGSVRRIADSEPNLEEWVLISPNQKNNSDPITS
jgi:hypothetical protein